MGLAPGFMERRRCALSLPGGPVGALCWVAPRCLALGGAFAAVHAHPAGLDECLAPWPGVAGDECGHHPSKWRGLNSSAISWL